MQVTDQVTKEGSVRVDLAGGTLDIPPIHLILKNVVTLNVATSLKAKVVLTRTEKPGIEIISQDYQKTLFYPSSDFTSDKIYYQNHFKEFTFIAQLIDLFGLKENLKVELSSGAPAGSGLGGSSAMGATFYSALCSYTGKKFDPAEAIRKVNGTEGRILNSGMPGYQDYYPALYGGVLALLPRAGEIMVDQLYNEGLANYLEDHTTLVFSGESRLSGINNWEVYKSFFDKNQAVINGMTAIADISYQAYLAIKKNNYEELLKLIGLEGDERKKLFPNIVTPTIHEVFTSMKATVPNLGMKMCGAGGGGCFLLTHGKNDQAKLKPILEKANMKILTFKVSPPL